MAYPRRQTKNYGTVYTMQLIGLLSVILLHYLTLLSLPHVEGVPGPDSTAIIANSGVNESIALAKYYAAKRGIPQKQVFVYAKHP
jgi:hypothetical protein